MWTVYYNFASQTYTVSQLCPGCGWVKAYGPDSWQACQAKMMEFRGY